VRSSSSIALSKSVLRDYKTASNNVYGEALPDLISFLIGVLDIRKDQIFYDIGSGIGNVVVQVAAQTLCTCYGIEIREDLHSYAQKNL